MDDLIERLERRISCSYTKDVRFTYTIVDLRLDRDLAAALRSYAEREKELVEALEQIDELSFSLGGACEYDQGYDAACERLGDVARSILAKHKEIK